MSEPKDKFNRYCAEVMGYEVEIHSNGDVRLLTGYKKTYGEPHNPYDDLNQMAPVVEKLIEKLPKTSVKVGEFVSQIHNKVRIKYACQNFIISTMPEEDDE